MLPCRLIPRGSELRVVGLPRFLPWSYPFLSRPSEFDPFSTHTLRCARPPGVVRTCAPIRPGFAHRPLRSFRTFLSWASSRFLSPAWRDGSCTPFHRGALKRLPPIHPSMDVRTRNSRVSSLVPPPWFCTTSMVFSALRLQVYCALLPTVGFLAFSLCLCSPSSVAGMGERQTNVLARSYPSKFSPVCSGISKSPWPPPSSSLGHGFSISPCFQAKTSFHIPSISRFCSAFGYVTLRHRCRFQRGLSFHGLFPFEVLSVRPFPFCIRECAENPFEFSPVRNASFANSTYTGYLRLSPYVPSQPRHWPR